MRRFLPPRSDARCASPSLPQGAKNSRERLTLRKAASVLAACSERRGALRGSTGARTKVAPVHAGKGSRTRWSRSWHTDRPRTCGECLLGPPFSVPRSDPPRIRREKIWCEVPDEEKNGSPPRMREKSSLPPDGNLSLRSTPAHAGNCSVLRNPGRNAAPRITPAHAGKRRPSHVYSQPFWDHPCLCREKICYEAPEDEKNGSPPPMRGKAVHKGLYRPTLRITPACAGKSSIVSSSVLRRRDHPRLCGEKSFTSYSSSTITGSPPPVRGKAEYNVSGNDTSWITPACAGKRSPRSPGPRAARDHPRLCGEKNQIVEGATSITGSPLPVRGKVRQPLPDPAHPGITPACAGKRFAQADRMGREQDHPRLCGEKIFSTRFLYRRSGSPPPVRGKAEPAGGPALRLRITPACAGKSGSSPDSDVGARDHPRLCGEKFPGNA